MAGKRQHTIPKFLLKGFAQTQKGKESYAWIFKKIGSVALNGSICL